MSCCIVLFCDGDSKLSFVICLLYCALDMYVCMYICLYECCDTFDTYLYYIFSVSGRHSPSPFIIFSLCDPIATGT